MLAAAPAFNAAENGIRRLISPNGGADAGRLALAKVLDDAGVPVSAGQRVGSEALRRREGMSAGGQALNEAQREALTRAALRTAGTDASRATPEVLAETAKRISPEPSVAMGLFCPAYHLRLARRPLPLSGVQDCVDGSKN